MTVKGVLMLAVAYMNWGRWISDCPREDCSYAFELQPGQERYVCRTRQGEGCGAEAPIEWPPDAAEIEAELQRRPVTSTRNWYPPGHPLAVATGNPDGQTVEDLRAEADEHGVM